MNSKYPLVPFSEILTKIDRKFIVEDTDEYFCGGVKWHGKGVFLREIKKGFEIKKKQQWTIKTGDIIYNKLFAWQGAFAIVDSKNEKLIVSDKFPTYRLNEKVIPEYLALFFKTNNIKTQAESLSKGSASISKLTLNPPDFLKLKIPLPEKIIQKEIIEKASTILNQSAKLKELTDNCAGLPDKLFYLTIEKEMEKYDEQIPIKDFLTPINEKINISDNIEYSQVTVKMNCKGVVERKKIFGLEIKQKRQNIVRANQFIFSKIDARHGAFGIIPNNLDEAIVSNDFPTFKINSDVIIPEFFYFLYSNPKFTYLCRKNSSGTTNRKRLKPEKFLNIKVNVPSKDKQKEMLNYFYKIQNNSISLNKLLINLEDTNSNLPPTILDKLFS